MASKKSPLFPEIIKVLNGLKPKQLPEERKINLQPLVNFIQSKCTRRQEIRINFICTHNSRRSHLAQIWAQAIAQHFSLQNVYCYSAGTEATAVFPMIMETLQNSGFQVASLSSGENPVYSVTYADNAHPVIAFSKTLDDTFNPKTEFAAVLTCSKADGDCPIVAGAAQRISMPFDDPKIFDKTPEQAEKYNERSLEIATELLYVFSQIQP
ncbi:protein-tyrosine-phosphatase [Flavimarina sp. Hel_I_48]|uniref:arsenate reductase/protein-tyrosine-phosphatase family protein n=1 Tax=Flavimarina sp. Hel_I_48 TaxID=1392488 RepID=UPI0004DEDF0A|nr:protein-tyrosine-phosphatase [Flavimarina sp. Hel_I_48]